MNDTFDNLSFSSILTGKSATHQTKGPSQLAEITLNDSLFLTESFLTQDLDVNNADSQLEIVSIPSKSTEEDAENKENLSLELSVKTSVNSQKPTRILSENTSLNISHNYNPNISGNHLMCNWGLPKTVLEKYQSKKITEMFPWQVECLSNVNVLHNNSNLIYSAPTSAGKTLVAEILAIKTIFERKKKVLFILPFVSIVLEKMYYFQDILGSSGIRVEGFMGSYNPPGGFQAVQLAICTIEKANSLINRLLEETTISDIGAVIVDEMHLLGDSSRGYLLELMLTKLLYISCKDPNVNIQIIGMSATLPNLSDLARWLNAELYMTTFRPIPLQEQAHVCGEIYDSNLKLTRKLVPIPDFGTDTDNILQLCLETIRESCSVLVFCPTKNWCENLSQQVAGAFFKMGSAGGEWGELLRGQLKTELIMEVLEQLKFCPVGLDEVLRKTVSFGVAFHHAGLTMDERDIIEGSFRNGATRVLVATSTLSSGVNLPAKRVIIRTPNFRGKPLDTLVYRQMIGRAGRMGKDTAGESILVCQKNDYKTAKELMNAQLQPVESCLEGSGKLKRAILEVIASGVATTPEDVDLFTKCTLLSIDEDNIENPIEEAVEFLRNNEFIRLHKSEDGCKYSATSLGKACLSSSIPPDEGLALFTELEKARQCFVLETELHLIYLVTPYSACNQWGSIDWMMYLDMWERLPASMKRVGELVGIREAYIVNATRGKIQTNTSKLLHRLLVHKRFFVSLALQDLVNEKPLGEVCGKFNCNRGMLQSLQQSAASFAGMVTAFSRQLGWSTVEILISQFQDRLQFGVSRDLLDLMRLPVLNGKMARTLYDSGVETLVKLAGSDVLTIEDILHKVLPFESEKEREGESEFDVKQRNKFRSIWITGKDGLTERQAAEILVRDARNYLTSEMGLSEAKWDSEENTDLLSNKIQTLSLVQNEIQAINESKVSNSNSSVFTTKFNQSDQSLFDESLKLSDSSDSGVDKERNYDSSSHLESDRIYDTGFSSSTQHQDLESESFLQKAFNTTFNTSDDIFSASLEEDYEDKTRKRCRNSLGEQTPSKRIKDEFDAEYKLEQSPVDFSKFHIVNVCADGSLIDIFSKELQEFNSISLAVACTKLDDTLSIGPNIFKFAQSTTPAYIHKPYKVNGFAICWNHSTVYYLSLDNPEHSSKILTILKTFLMNPCVRLKIFDAKEQLKLLKHACDIDFYGQIEDPKVADWLLEPDGREKTLQAMVLEYCSEAAGLCQTAGSTKGVGSIAMELTSSVDCKLRASVEALITWHLVDSVKNVLGEKLEKFNEIYDTEMKTLLCLLRAELSGTSVSKQLLEKLVESLKSQLIAIEKQAFSLAGRHFSFTSPSDVAKVIGMFKGRKVSTRKEILEQNNHPISNLVLQWRKLNCTLTKMIYPLLRSTKTSRIHGCYTMHTSTGRISMQEPNLQNVAKDFIVVNTLTHDEVSLSCRSTFVCADNYILISADYCQLELRILAHLSQDKVLLRIMNTPGDVFRSIAAKWNRIEEQQVDERQRHHAKQLCYGIIYGMGSKALAEQLSIEETDAVEFIESFKNTYPGIKIYLKATIDSCRQTGYVETLFGRRRFLPNISSSEAILKGHAERQAVNTTIQGSAADIAKRAMVLIDDELQTKFEKNRNIPKLVLHLHDELMYEVPVKYTEKVARIIRKSMENCVKLSVVLPVKVKTGPSWGQLTEYFL